MLQCRLAPEIFPANVCQWDVATVTFTLIVFCDLVNLAIDNSMNGICDEPVELSFTSLIIPTIHSMEKP